MESFVFADATARAAGTGYTILAEDVGKIAYQTDTGDYWRLTDDSPLTWAQITGGTGTFPSESANTVLAGPATGSPAAPAFRALVAADIPALPYDASGAAAAAQSAAESYADGLFAANDALLYKGVIDCSGNPNYPAADAGHVYKISVAGKIGGASGVNVEVGDTALCTVDGSASGTQAAVGANWDIIQGNVDFPIINSQLANMANKTYKGRHSAGTGAPEDVAAADVLADIGAADVATAKAEVLIIACSDETTAITTGTAKVTFRMPFAMTLSSVRASLTTASSSGNPAIDINEGGVSIFSTTLTIDSGEKTSTTAATPAVISDASLADDAEMTVDIDSAGTGATGLKITLIGTRA